MFPSQKITADNKEYFYFTGPARLNKAVHELEGILHGVTADARVETSELSRLTRWIGDHQEFQQCGPFRQTIEMLNTVLADGIIEAEELADLFWMCSRFTEENGYYSELTADMQRLQGLLTGLAADRIVSRQELDALREWIEAHSQLKGCWPYDELDSLLVHILSDGVVTVEEHAALLRYFDEFTCGKSGAVELKGDLKHFGIDGICAVAPEVSFPGMTFCFTGSSKRATRADIQVIVEGRGGIFWNRVTKTTDYLVVGANGNPCWAFSCYGRKVEDAMTLRKSGQRLLIVHEVDFWDHLN